MSISLSSNQDLINKLIEIVQPKMDKIAQTAPATPADPNMVKTIAGKMLDNLEKETGISTDKSDAAAFMKDLNSLDSLVAFLKTENVHYNGKPIITNTLELDEKPDQYAQYALQTGFDAFPANTTVWIYKDGLIGYLRSLNQQVSPENSDLVNTVINKLAQEANEKLKLGITPEQLGKGTSPAAEQINQETELDSINIPLDPASPLSTPRNAGNIKIKAKDLKSKATFDDFAKHLTIMSGGKAVEYSNFTDASYCEIISVLYTRAKSYAYRRNDKADATYLQLISDLASQYQCPVGESAQPQQKGDAQTVSYKSVQEKQMGSQEKVIATSLAQKMPLKGDRIDIPRIVGWLNVYAKINKSPIASVALNNALQTANYIMNTYRVDTQPLSAEASAIAQTIITTVSGNVQHKSNAPLAYLQLLRKLIGLVGTILGSYKSAYYDSLPSDLQTEIDDQIGGGGSSFYNINIDAVNTWVSDLPSALKQIMNQGF